MALRYVNELNRLVRLDKIPDFPRFLKEVRVRKRSWKKASMDMGVEKMQYLCQFQRSMAIGSTKKERSLASPGAF